MDQFEEIRRKNKRIVVVLLSVPVFIVILSITALLLYIPFFMKAVDNGNLQREIINREEMTAQEADTYFIKLTEDIRINEMMASDVAYNIALAKLNIKKDDYDEAIEDCSLALNDKESVFYHYYLAQAYLGKGRFNDARRELATVTAASEESFWEASIYDSEAQALADSIQIKLDAQSRINLIDFRKNIVDASADTKLTKEESAGYISRFKTEDEFAESFFGDSEFVYAYLNLCVGARDFEEIKRTVPRAVAIKDDALYHYYLALAYLEAGDTFDEVTSEIEIFFTKDTIADSESKKALLRETVFNNFAELYYERDKYNESKKLIGRMVEEEMVYASGIRLETLKEFKSVVLEGKSYDAEILIDSDSDGMGDELEKGLGTNPNEKDSDGDGYEDEKEIIFGHDPLKKSPDDQLGGGDYFLSYYAQIPNIEPQQQTYSVLTPEEALAIMTSVPMFIYEHKNY